MNKVLMQVIVECILFFELSDDARVDPDAAVQQMEQIAWSLQQLSAADKAEFLEHVRLLASQAEQDGQVRRWQCLRDLPEALGFAASE